MKNWSTMHSLSYQLHIIDTMQLSVTSTIIKREKKSTSDNCDHVCDWFWFAMKILAAEWKSTQDHIHARNFCVCSKWSIGWIYRPWWQLKNTVDDRGWFYLATTFCGSTTKATSFGSMALALLPRRVVARYIIDWAVAMHGESPLMF